MLARIPFSCQPNPCQNNLLVIFLPISLVQKGRSIAFAFSYFVNLDCIFIMADDDV